MEASYCYQIHMLTKLPNLPLYICIYRPGRRHRWLLEVCEFVILLIHYMYRVSIIMLSSSYMHDAYCIACMGKSRAPTKDHARQLSCWRSPVAPGSGNLAGHATNEAARDYKDATPMLKAAGAGSRRSQATREHLSSA